MSDLVPTVKTAESQDETLQKLQKLIKLTEKPPKKIARHSQGFDYVPIDALETQLNELFFGLWNWEINDVRIVANEIVVYGTLSVFNPIAKVWIKRSGIGAAQIRIKKGKEPSVENKIPNALQLDAPHANAEAFKNACASLGKKFGRGLRRDITTDYEPLIKEPTQAEAELIKILESEKPISNERANEIFQQFKDKIDTKKLMKTIKEYQNGN